MDKAELAAGINEICKDYRVEHLPQQVISKDNTHYTPIPVLKIGEGNRVFIAEYGIHGNEEAGAYAFFETPKQILALLEEKPELYNSFTYYGVLMNPVAVIWGVRCYNDEGDEHDFNRGWGNLYLNSEFAHPYIKTAARFFEAIIQKYGANKIVNLSHHEFEGKWLINPFFVPPLPRYIIESDGKPNSLGEEIDCLVKASTASFKRKGVHYYGEGESDDLRYKGRFGEAPYKPHMVKRSHGKTLDDFFLSRGVPSVAMETGKRILFSRKNLDKRVSVHTLVDLAFLETLLDLSVS